MIFIVINCPSDNGKPIISNMPNDITHDTDSGLATAVVTWIEPTATDNSGIQTLTSTHEPGSSFDIGVTTVTYTSTDPSGLETTETFSVTVEGEVFIQKVS